MLARFPHADKRNVRLYYLFNIGANGSWIVGNWIFFWLRYMSYGQLGLVDALMFAFGLFMEIPTGAVGDIVGKKRSIILAFACGTVGILIMAGATSLYMIMIGFAITQTGWAFYSGAAEALVYDTLVAHGVAEDYDKVAAVNSSMGTIIHASTLLIGGGLYALHFRLPHYAWAASYAFGLVVALFLTEPARETPASAVTFSSFFLQLRDGLRQLALPGLRYYIPLIFMISGLLAAYGMGLLMPAIAVHFGLNADAQAITFSALAVLKVGVVAQLPAVRRRMGDFWGLMALALLVSSAFMLSALPSEAP